MTSHLNNLSVVTAEPERKELESVVVRNSGNGSVNGAPVKETVVNSDKYVGVLEVFVHQARDIQNICIYHKQDVYARLCLTNDLETTFSTKIINGGGKNPVFNDSLRLDVRNLDASLKCEVWMMSRVKNYLGDQLLGFAMVPLSDIFAANGRLAQEFSLSSTDLYHSPAGYVELSISYYGAQPDVFAIPTPRASLTVNTVMEDLEILDSVPNDYDKIEFPDPSIVNETQFMVSQYFGLDSESSESLNTTESDSQLNSSAGVRVVESFSEGSFNSTDATNKDTPASSVATNESPSVSITASSPSACDTPGASQSSNQELVSDLKEKKADISKDESVSSNGILNNKSAHSVFGVNIVPEKTVVQQDIVDMYMKSMQQFTESLAKMKLPMDVENGTIDSANSNGSSEQKLQAPKSTGSRVFYGSRAFF
ncbi:Calcium-dependent lipid-binding (CaLB domain) family protein [Thalictrum thalictroides]|uniref:Calcium-dependent lipid-binding (CaLB domain) family protein n=1 Tax=Thalictrum thalictroides TaxID=46969 RepID=A0A7J6UU23_THATH|nr:Calcium-dependent lipid-binding (CaLB domain) family protein [Thalictrum thalictroides]